MDSVGIPFDECSARVQKHLEDVYGIRIVTRDISDPLTGDLDGAEVDNRFRGQCGTAAVSVGARFQARCAGEFEPGVVCNRPTV
jgi:hypothetical protein